MQKRYSYIQVLLITLLLVPVGVWAQTAIKKVVVEISNNKYTPQDITINIGDTVEFKLIGGNHPTVSDDNIWTPFTLSSVAPSKKLSSEFTAPGQFLYHCQLHGAQGGYPSGMTGKITVNGSTGIASQHTLSNSLNIYPNPINEQINIEYYLKKDVIVSIRILDVLGKEVAVLLTDKREAGNQKEFLELNNKIPGGMYFVKIAAGTETIMKRISVM